MVFIADLHIHSRFSRATSRSLNAVTLDDWAGRKGIGVIGTGDATHPGWLEEIEAQLEESEPGMYRLKTEFAVNGGGKTRFVLSAEISSIYKKGGQVRKVHSLILLPDFAAAHKLADRLDAIGNIRSDGRPILGLDAKDLLSICLAASPETVFIPAHIWTPWFSLLGSKSGFDSVEECFDDMSEYIFALETGLSSDPAMNWRLSALDRYSLVSNSDAHSPEKLGREANLFDTDVSYPAMVEALKSGKGFGGTIEFFPEEGKYHLDGHRKCGVRLEPEATRSMGGRCPVCGKELTVGVYSRVLDLADRPEGTEPERAKPYDSLIPLTEILGEVCEVGPQSKRVKEAYDGLIRNLGPEIQILREATVSDIAQAGGALLAEAIGRMREGRVIRQAGYDGEFGVIRLFGQGEMAKLTGQKALFVNGSKQAASGPIRKTARKEMQPEPDEPVSADESEPSPEVLIMGDPLLDDLNMEQRSAVIHQQGPQVITAGPGTGKTLVLTRRAAWLIREGLAKPQEILGVTFTRQAAGEMLNRLKSLLPFRLGSENRLAIQTFHALGLSILKDLGAVRSRILDEEERLDLIKNAVKSAAIKAPRAVEAISLAKQNLQEPSDLVDEKMSEVFRRYEQALQAADALDMDDLVRLPVMELAERPEVLTAFRQRWPFILVDEYQDINHAQYRLIRLLAPTAEANLSVIGDPDQAIYGFRGADAEYFQRFQEDYPGAASVTLHRNYRSTDTILQASGQVIAANGNSDKKALRSGIRGPAKVTAAELPTPAAEAEYVVWQMEQLLGGTSHFSLNSGRAESAANGLGLNDFAVLYRLHGLAEPVAEVLRRAGLPFQQAGVEPIRETDGLDFKADKISLLTMHAAKGLEFKVVFVIGLESGIVPYEPPNKPPAEVDEERRLFYVAMTRAKERLYLTRSLARTLYGRRTKPTASPFRLDIRKDLLQKDHLPEKKRSRKARQLSLF